MKYSMEENGFKGHLPFGELLISSDDSAGFRPYQLLVSSLAVCSGGVLRKVLEKMRMPAEDIQIEVKEVVRNEEEANRLEKVHLHFVLKGKFDSEKLSRAMELTRKNCSMLRTVEGAVEVVETYEVI